MANKIAMSPAQGENIDQMRRNFANTPLWKRGDARLMWVNEGDLIMAEMNGQIICFCAQSTDDDKEG